MNIIFGSDHGGYQLKQVLAAHLEKKGHRVTDAGAFDTVSSDYAQYALVVARSVAKGEFDRGILICGTGLGMSMAANRIMGVRAALCANEFTARMSRAHNDANVLCLGERTTGTGLALAILDAWMDTEYEADPRHIRRIGLFNRIG
jgi:ribose 5-phosphate isomerase B